MKNIGKHCFSFERCGFHGVDFFSILDFQERECVYVHLRISASVYMHNEKLFCSNFKNITKFNTYICRISVLFTGYQNLELFN